MRFCPDDCPWLWPTEDEQNDYLELIDIKPPHMCGKVGRRVYHGLYHPKLIQLEECKKEILFRKFD